ncbi:proteasome assembly chaperone 2 [Brachionus plicatilis]|uniref:Proteasome assembly chaperone 2 n=1 Tax=Brachionus plicatilis TaxID=10195 RepID=A0A3M7S8H4_BRAPC|nr:proteasome assembly chaperone 2 [Brachionus plicatilis]
MGSSISKMKSPTKVYDSSWEIIDRDDPKLFDSGINETEKCALVPDKNADSQHLDKLNYTVMENKFVKLSPDSDWSEYTFVFASVSVGNIGQLAVDLLISSLSNTQKCGYLISNLVQPIAGHNAFVQNSSDISLSCELYENSNLKLVLMQQRSPLLKGKRNQFVQILSDFIKQEKFRESVCLTSSHAYERLDSQLTGVQCRYLASDESNKKNFDQNLNWKILEKRIDHNGNLSTDQDPSLDFFIPGGGISQKFYKSSIENSLNSTVLLVFAHEGNNIPETLQLVNYFNEWKNYLIKPSQWRIPISWKYLFGSTLDSAAQIY